MIYVWILNPIYIDEPILSFQRNSFFSLQDERKVCSILHVSLCIQLPCAIGTSTEQLDNKLEQIVCEQIVNETLPLSWL